MLGNIFTQNKKVLELGAGIGLAGMVSAALGAGRVVLTDGDAKVLDCKSDDLFVRCAST
jgi:predicted nicotinamide N-methyase